MPARKDLSEEHSWVAAVELAIDNRVAAGAYRQRAAEVKAGQWVTVLDLYCRYCRRTFDAARNDPCDKASPVLRGGPVGTRRQNGLPIGTPAASEA